MRSLNGEDSDSDALAQLQIVDDQVHSSSPASSSPHSPSSPTRPGTSQRGVHRGPTRRNQFPGFIPGSSGGYYGTEGQSDWAMEREMEIQRLEDENKALREMLGIAEEAAAAEEVPDHTPAHEEKSPILGAQHRHSLTVEELEAGAEQEEAAAKERAEHPEAEEESRPPLDPSVVDFRAAVGDDVPPENVIDETDGTPA